jgi:hypothetical protein
MPMQTPSAYKDGLRQQTGRFYCLGSMNPSGVAVVANRIYFHPFIVTEGRAFAQIAANVVTLAAGNVRLGVYSDAQGQPGNLLYTAGTASTGTTGDKIIALAQALPSGPVWLASQYDAAPTMAYVDPTNYKIYNNMLAGGFATSPSSGTLQFACWMTQAYASGLAASASGLTWLGDNQFPNICLQG